MSVFRCICALLFVTTLGVSVQVFAENGCQNFYESGFACDEAQGIWWGDFTQNPYTQVVERSCMTGECCNHEGKCNRCGPGWNSCSPPLGPAPESCPKDEFVCGYDDDGKTVCSKNGLCP